LGAFYLLLYTNKDTKIRKQFNRNDFCHLNIATWAYRLSTSYKILSNVLLSQLSPYMAEIIGDHQCGFRHKRSTTD
jgi:hypothetical protein